MESLAHSLKNRGHVVIMDKLFLSVGTERKGIYAIGTVRSNRIGLPSILKNMKITHGKSPQGTLDCRMHKVQKLYAVMWKDKKRKCLHSSHSLPMEFFCKVVEVLRREGAVYKLIKTSPLHLEYTTFIHGVDIADHLRGTYSSQVHSHKWWH